LPLLLDLYDSFDIRSTFFFTGYIARKFPKVVLSASQRGHEVASHGLSHKKEHGFDVLDYKEQKNHLSESKKILEDIAGKEVICFRSPALRVNGYTASALAETGYKIDSSVASQRFDLFMSFGIKNKIKWFKAPRLPYLTAKDSLMKRGEGPIVEVPLSAGVFPYVGTTMRIFPLISKLVRNLLMMENSINNKPIVFDIHPNEFIDESGKERRIEKRSSSFLEYFFADFLRSKLKAKNLGLAAVELFKNELSVFKEKNYRAVTVQEYCRETGLLK
jgi:peptidoglycan/xylan/chitin deacetylase (PgdA/CDA1 family)